MAETKIGRLPLYKRVTDQLREQCLASSGEMLPSLRQLSQELEVNHATISRALRDLEEEGIVEIVPRKGTFSLGRSHAQSNVELIVLVSETTNLLDVALLMAEGMKRESQQLRGEGAAVQVSRSVLSSSPLPDAERFINELKSRGTTGVVCLGFGFLEGEAAEAEADFIAAVAQKLPVVLVGGSHPTLALSSVYGDPGGQMQQFLQNCYDQGLRDFEYLGNQGNNSLQLQRREGFEEFLAQNDLSWDWNRFKTLETPELAEQLRALPELPEVVVATNVRRAFTLALEAQRRGLQLPQDLQILCFASLLEHAQPLLPYASVVLLDEPEVGARAMQILQKSEPQSEAEPRIERVPAHFISGPFQGGPTDQNLETAATAPVLVTF